MKTRSFQGAFVASLSIPWGETKDDNDCGGYHLVWTRDLVHTATALLAAGQTESPLRALIWLACVQAARRQPAAEQLDRWQRLLEGHSTRRSGGADSARLATCSKHDALRQFDPGTLISRAATAI